MREKREKMVFFISAWRCGGGSVVFFFLLLSFFVLILLLFSFAAL